MNWGAVWRSVQERRHVHVDHPRLVLHDCLGHPVHRLMRRPLRTIPIRPVAEVRFEDRLQHEFERTLDHPVPNRRNPQDADLAPVFRDRHVPVPERPVGASDQRVPQFRQKLLHPGPLDRRKRHPVETRGPVVLLGDLVRRAQRLQLRHVHVQAPTPPVLLSLRLAVEPPSQVLQTDGYGCHRTPAFHVVGGVADQ